ncbi:hypothetical protein HanXRQr2_Chr14g0654991 [Helianthus annuus]|uniref:Uncharacterized protein n=1 Tax=Helianthus annuus TaxID=4232 RepID=A0A9K3EBX7_HELAN|nr:hypothetical protein HanXRQr2_Chr14g0654991 [Helianthus annuus]KAJ0841217.1 hypothetical protein HanPSC8_Chr14g0627911 [Helianthus annuus]
MMSSLTVSGSGGPREFGSPHPLLSWCNRRASFNVFPHSMLSKSRWSVSTFVWSASDGSGGSGNLAQHLLTMSVVLQFALSKLQFPTLNSNPLPLLHQKNNHTFH